MTTTLRVMMIGLFGSALMLVAVNSAQRVLADGIPTVDPLYYAGYLTEHGQPVNGPRQVAIYVWPNASAIPGERALCATEVESTPIVEGRFRVPLSATCIEAVRARADAFVEVVFDIDKSLGRAKIGAVPYAVEADRANSAAAARGALSQQLVPQGAVIAFDLATCPPGFSEHAAARGRTLIGANDENARGATPGEAAHTLRAEEMPVHAHTMAVFQPVGQIPMNSVTDLRVSGGPLVGSAYGTSIPSSAAGGGEAFSNMQPSLALLYCRKD